MRELIPILQYTSVIEKDNGRIKYCTTAEKFEQDIQTILSEGYTVLSLRELEEGVQIRMEDVGKMCCIVFKGGYLDNYTVVYPILKKYNVKVPVFVATELIGVSHHPNVEHFVPHFGFEQAQEMIDSGLVDIYALWHPLDEEKDFKLEVQNKFSLLDKKLKGNNSRYAFYHDYYNEEIISQLDSSGVEINITDIVNFKREHLHKVKPVMSVEYTVDVLDSLQYIEEFIYSVIEQENQTSQVDNFTLVADDAVLSHSVELPINKKPMVKNYLRHAFPLSIMQTERIDRVKRFILQEYIDIYKPFYDWFDYHNYLYDHWECLKFRKTSRDILSANNITIVDFILSALKIGYYCDIWLDTYYIPGKPGHGKTHTTHGLLIYGYDAAIQSFKTLTYTDTGKYEDLIVLVENLAAACSNDFFSHINLLKNEINTVVKYDIHIIREKLKKYIDSECYDDNMRYSKKSSEQYYNYNASCAFLNNIETKALKNKSIHRTALYSYVEQKRIMMWRLQYLNEYEHLNIPDLKQKAQLVEAKSEMLLNLGLKYNILQNQHIIQRVKTLIEWINKSEVELINSVLFALDDKYGQLEC